MQETSMTKERARWQLRVNRETDRAVRERLAITGRKKGDLSRYVEEAVQMKMLRSLGAIVPENFYTLPNAERNALVSSALAGAGDMGDKQKV
jgi:hypothetical protein